MLSIGRIQATPAIRPSSPGRETAAAEHDRPLQWSTAIAANGLRVGSPNAPRGPAYGPRNFLLGANLPWVEYGNDFGANSWHPQGGIARPGQRSKLDSVLGRLAQDGIKHIRWFMLCDGRSGIDFAPDGTPLGLDAHVFPDLDAALATARRRGVSITFSLIDFGWLGKPEIVNGVKLKGHGDVIRDPVKRRALLEKVFKPLLERYGSDPAILAWDIINEPEWATLGIGTLRLSNSATRSQMREFIGAAVGYVHRYTGQQATVGSASTFTLGLVKGLDLDFYQAHWYDYLNIVAPLDRPVAHLQLDRPLILGEFPTSKTRKSTKAILDTVHQAGYGGAMPWAVLSEDKFSGYDARAATMAKWAEVHARDLYRPSPGG